MNESTTDTAALRLPEAKDTEYAGVTLSGTLYAFPLTIAINGALGVGKTTFIRGFLRANGVTEPIVSPTYALEQRYRVERFDVMHLDLYRLNEKQAQELVHSTDDHTGIRLIEWADRLNRKKWIEPLISIELEETDKPTNQQTNPRQRSSEHGRSMTVRFSDLPLPSRAQIEAWRRDVSLPPHIALHCDAVADFADRCAKILLDRGIILRPLALRRAAEAHDLFRFLDFTDGAEPPNEKRTTKNEKPDPMRSTAWERIRLRYPHLRHEAACARFLTERGFAALGSIVATHGLSHPPGVDATIEQKLLYYADKRVMIERVVSLEERFADFRKRYGKSHASEESERWYGEVHQVERDLFPEGAP